MLYRTTTDNPLHLNTIPAKYVETVYIMEPFGKYEESYAYTVYEDFDKYDRLIYSGCSTEKEKIGMPRPWFRDIYYYDEEGYVKYMMTYVYTTADSKGTLDGDYIFYWNEEHNWVMASERLHNVFKKMEFYDDGSVKEDYTSIDGDSWTEEYEQGELYTMENVGTHMYAHGWDSE
jgi:hypothetical protein